MMGANVADAPLLPSPKIVSLRTGIVPPRTMFKQALSLGLKQPTALASPAMANNYY
jgi:hypothetical protein